MCSKIAGCCWPRRRLRARTLVTLKQIHSNLTRRVTRADADRVMRADGLMTDDPEVMLGIQTADCVPVLVRDRRTHAVAAFHAGWRGTLKRIVEGGIGKMRLEFGSRPEELEAAIGPAIGACCYAVGEEVRSEFLSQFSYAPELFSEVYDSDPVKEKYPLLFLTARAPGHSNMGPNLHLDLIEANRRQLLDAGLACGADCDGVPLHELRAGDVLFVPGGAWILRADDGRASVLAARAGRRWRSLRVRFRWSLTAGLWATRCRSFASLRMTSPLGGPSGRMGTRLKVDERNLILWSRRFRLLWDSPGRVTLCWA